MEVAYNNKQYQVCKDFALKVLLLMPENLNSLRGYALSCFFLEEYEESMMFLLKALEISKEKEFEYTYIGWCLCNMNNHIKACEAFEKAVEANPLYEPALVGRTSAYVHLHAERLDVVNKLDEKFNT